MSFDFATRCKLLIAPLFVLASHPLFASGMDDRESRLRAAFVYNFASFTQWPNAAAPTFQIGVWHNAGATEAAKAELSGKQVHGAALEILSLTDAAAARSARIIVIDSDLGSADLGKLLGSLNSKPVLTVSRFDTHCSSGVMICFRKDGEKLRFVVSKSAVDKSGLKLSSQLLKLAQMLP